jgi:hypothetical protein
MVAVLITDKGREFSGVLLAPAKGTRLPVVHWEDIEAMKSIAIDAAVYSDSLRRLHGLRVIDERVGTT